MRSTGWLFAPLLLTLGFDQAGAQVLVPVGVPVYAYGGGIGGVYRGHHLAIGGYVGGVNYGVGGYGLSPYSPFGSILSPGLGGPIAPYGMTQIRQTINYNFPPTIVIAPSRDDDVSGVDLDLMPPANRGGPAGPPRFKQVRPPPERKQEAPPEVRGRLPPPLEKPPMPAPEAKMPPPPREPPPLPQPPPPAKDPRIESKLQVEAGLKAFSDQEHGLAVQRFRQAFRVDPNNVRACFLMAQAQFALGKFREAVVSIQEGLELEPDWPRADFRPRLELYKGHEADFAAQFKQLQDAVAKKPGDRHLLFLDAYQLWFDGQRAEAVKMFTRARALTLDTTYIDRFLRAARPGVVAAAR